MEAAQGGEWASGLNRQTDCAGERLEEFYQFRPQHPGMYRQIPWYRLFGIHRIIEVYLASRNTDWKNFHTHCVGEYHPPPVLVLFVPTERSEQDDGGHPPCERMFCHLLMRDLSFRFMLVAATPRCASRGEFPLMVQNQKVSPSR